MEIENSGRTTGPARSDDQIEMQEGKAFVLKTDNLNSVGFRSSHSALIKKGQWMAICSRLRGRDLSELV